MEWLKLCQKPPFLKQLNNCLDRRWISGRTVRREMVMVLFESIDFIRCMLLRKKPVNVQKFISEAPVKRFDKCVVRWFSRSGKI